MHLCWGSYEWNRRDPHTPNSHTQILTRLLLHRNMGYGFYRKCFIYCFYINFDHNPSFCHLPFVNGLLLWTKCLRGVLISGWGQKTREDARWLAGIYTGTSGHLYIGMKTFVGMKLGNSCIILLNQTYLFTSLTCLFVQHIYTCILQDKGVISVHVPPDCKVQRIVLTASCLELYW